MKHCVNGQDVNDTHYVIGSVVGSYSFSHHSPGFQSIIGVKLRSRYLRKKADYRMYWWPVLAGAVMP